MLPGVRAPQVMNYVLTGPTNFLVTSHSLYKSNRFGVCFEPVSTNLLIALLQGARQKYI